MNAMTIKDGKLMLLDNQNENNDYMLMGYRGKQTGNSDTIFYPYVPKQLSDEEYAKRYLAGKTFAFVKKDYPDDLYVNKKCEVLEMKETRDGKMYLLKVDISFKAVGYVHWMAIESKYEEIWFKEKDIESLLRYDDDGKIIK